MPLTRRSLALSVDPGAARLARKWVAEVLTELDRDDLVPGARQAVSELVTNAVLHAEPPIAVRVRGTRLNPRVEVSDGSPRAPRQLQLPVPDDAIATFGRGLALVSAHSSLWGWDREPDGGKTVWFVPCIGVRDDIDLAGIADEAEPLDRAASEPPPPEGGIELRLLNMPAQLFGQLRRYHFELRRELRLLAFSDPERYPLAVRVTRVFAQGDAERSATWGVSALDEAIARGEDSVDLHYIVPPTVPDTMAEILDLFARIRERFADEQLLAIAPDDTLLELQTWYFTEFIRQARGEAPIPWPGPAR